MKKLIALSLLAATVCAAPLAVPSVALADGNVSCAAATRAERKPPAELTAKLKGQGWVIRKMQMYNNCYEVYGFDENKKPVEAFFDPKTLERVRVQP